MTMVSIGDGCALAACDDAADLLCHFDLRFRVPRRYWLIAVADKWGSA